MNGFVSLNRANSGNCTQVCLGAGGFGTGSGGDTPRIQTRVCGFACGLGGADQCARLVLAFLMFGGGIAVRDDADAGLHVQRAVFNDAGSQGDAGIHGAIGRKVADAARIDAAFGRLQLVNDFHRPDLRRAGPGPGREGMMFWIVQPDAEVAPSRGSHVGFAGGDRAEVDAFHAAAMSAGARDNGAPGLRPEYSDSYYGAFVLDPDGHTIEALCLIPV